MYAQNEDVLSLIVNSKIKTIFIDSKSQKVNICKRI